MKHLYISIVLFFVIYYPAITVAQQPNHEFRAVWVSTVWKLDWPKTSGAEAQKTEMMTLLDNIKKANFNVVLLQVRTESDALYQSSKEPWSRWLTGTQGKDPGYDPLAFAIEEAHKRGLELHAWINPFRVNASTSGSTIFSDDHVSKTRPEWMLEYSNGSKIINPGIPECREYIASVVGEIVRKYEVDGIHFDDYFYSYSGTTNQDAATYDLYGDGFASVGDWRRFNINETIRLVHDTVKLHNPAARFGVSPFGIWKSGVPEGIVGLSAYNQIYADALHWLNNHTVDYITPQLYWPIGGQQDFRKLLTWWADRASAAGRHLYAGHTLNEITGPTSRIDGGMRSIAIFEEEVNVKSSRLNKTGRMATQSVEEVPNQIAIVRENRAKNALGSVMFRSSFLLSNAYGFLDYLKENTYSYPAAPPAMPWLPKDIPMMPLGVTGAILPETGDYTLSWVRNEANTHSFKRYLVYNTNVEPASFQDIPEGSVRALVSAEALTVNSADVPFGTSYWVVTELGRSNDESEISNPVVLENDPAPVITSPTQTDTVIKEAFVRLDWRLMKNATGYHYQWSDQADFSTIISEDEALSSSVSARRFNGLAPGGIYYFRLRARNNTGWSEWTSTYKIAVDETVTGLADAGFGHKILTYPNPAGPGEKMMLSMALTKRSEVDAQLVSLDGQILLQVADGLYDRGEHSIDIQRGDIRKGFYLLVLWVNGHEKVQRVIFR